MVVINSMAGRSQLELMLDKLQQSENDQINNSNVLPPLPARPVSRASRLPRAMKPSIIDSKSEIYEIEGATVKEIKEHTRFDRSKEISVKTICDIQKFYRSHKVHCYYKNLREGVITLQSFVRGEKARRDYDRYRSKRLGIIIMMQKQVRNYLNRRVTKHGLDQLDPVELMDEKPEDGCSKSTIESSTTVKHSVLIDLQKHILRTEAKARQKNEENVSLKRQLEEMELRWRLYEEKMSSMEKTWQDQFTYIQECLHEAKKNRSHEIGIPQLDSTFHNSNSDIHRSDFVLDSCNDNPTEAEQERICRKSNQEGELRKLKVKFKLWKKEYKHKLRDMQSMFKRIGNNSQTHKNWWGKIIT